MVDIVIRVFVVDGEHRLSFKSDEVIFGGGRINPEKKEIPNNYNVLMDTVYNEKVIRPSETTEAIIDNSKAVTEETEPVKKESAEEPIRKRRRRVEENNVSTTTETEPTSVEPDEEPANRVQTEEPTEEPKKRTRRSRKEI